MRILCLLTTILLCSSAAGGTTLVKEPAGAHEKNKSHRMSTGIARQHVLIPQPFKLFMGNISAALLAVDHGKLDLAQRHLEYAKQNVHLLEADAPNFSIAERLKTGKFEYTTVPNKGARLRQQRYVLVPFDDGVFPVQLPRLEKKMEKKLKLRPQDARVVFLHIDLKRAKAKMDLEEAMQALSANRADAVAGALQKILAEDIGPEDDEPGDKLQAAYNQIMLADALLQEKNYAFCRLALLHAQRRLSQYAAFKGSKYDDQVRALYGEIQGVISDLRNEDPTPLEKAGDKMHRWLNILKSWFIPHSKPIH